MAGFDLPEECPECGRKASWYVPEDHSITIRNDGSVRIGHGNGTRYGQKVKATCNSRDCDAIVNIYLEAEAVNNGQIKSTGAVELLEKLEEHGSLPNQIEKECGECGQEFVTEASVELANDGGIVIRAKKQCPDHKWSAFLYETVEHIEPEKLEEKAELLPKSTVLDDKNGDTE